MPFNELKGFHVAYLYDDLYKLNKATEEDHDYSAVVIKFDKNGTSSRTQLFRKEELPQQKEMVSRITAFFAKHFEMKI